MNGRLKEAALSNHVGAPPATAATPEPDVGPLLIEAGQATIPDHIGRKDGRKPPFNAIVGHKRPPPIGRSVDVSKHLPSPDCHSGNPARLNASL